MKQEKSQNQIENEKLAELEPLVEKAVAGDGDALRALCEELGKEILFRINRMLGKNINAMDAEDVSQEVFLRICENISTLRDPKAFRMWLTSIISNETTQFLRGKLKRGIILDINDYYENFVDENADFIPEDYVRNNELRKEMIDIIEKLPTRQRQTIMHYYYDDLSVAEIAQVMNVTRQGVSKNLSLAVERIKRELENLPSIAIFGIVPAMPIESALRELLRVDAAHFIPPNPDWLQIALAPCEQYFIAGSVLITGGAGAAATATAATATAATATSAGAAAATAATATATSVSATLIASVVLTCALLVAPIVASTTAPAEYPPMEIPMVSGYIHFYDGIDLGEHYKRINPKSARLNVDTDIQIIEWWIVNENNEVVLRSDADGDMEEVQINPNEFESDGLYYIIFRFESESGETYRMGSNFLIEKN